MFAVSTPTPDNDAKTLARDPLGIRHGRIGDFKEYVGDTVYFETDKSELAPVALSLLEKQAAWLKRYNKVMLMIEGHCDERGTRNYNLALGERRANAVKAYLVAKGIPEARLKTISYGYERPIVAVSDEAAWAKNRRAVSIPFVNP